VVLSGSGYTPVKEEIYMKSNYAILFTLATTLIGAQAFAQSVSESAPKKILNCEGDYLYDGVYFAHADFTGSGPDQEAVAQVEVTYGRHRGPDDSRYAYEEVEIAHLSKATDHSATYTFSKGSISLSIEGNSISFLDQQSRLETIKCTIDSEIRR
jgi:hypothetical protein